jgi:metallo-beta-lactamase family protein
MEVTGSCHLLECGEQNILLDCGMHQGGDAVRRLSKEKFGFKPVRIDAVILSHAHLDHSGLLPRLVRAGFKGPIYCTAATRNLLAIMLEDAANIYFRDLEEINKRRKRKGQREEKAQYAWRDVVRALEQCRPLEYGQWHELDGDIRVRLDDAGHILGSAVVNLGLPADEHGAAHRLVYSGDLGNADTVMLRRPAVPERADTVLMESTYGNRDHKSLRDTLIELREIIDRAEDEDGCVLMPAFAVGRTQELLFHLGVMYHQGQLQGWRVYLDSPMAIEVTRVYDQWFDAMAKQDQQVLDHYDARSLEQFLPILTLTPSVEESMQINRLKNRVIVIAGSGMCTGGRIHHHFKHRIWRENTHIVFAGFQARNTPGRRLVDGARTLRMFGDDFAVKAQVHTLGGFSAHASRSELLDWAAAIGGYPKFRLVHGEPEALEVMRDTLAENNLPVTIARAGETVDLE